MKFRCERDALVEALTSVGRAIGGRSGPEPGRNLLVEARGGTVHLVGHDIDLDLVIECDVVVAVSAEGSVVMPVPLVSDIIRAFEPGAVAVEVGHEEARITAGRSEFTVRTYPVADFPRVPPVEGEGISLSGQGLGEALRQVVRAASGEQERGPAFKGVVIADEGGALRFVATDSYRLALRDIEGGAGLGEGRSVLVPARALNELQRLLGAGASPEKSVVFHAGESYAAFDVGSVRLTTRLIRAEFPEYRHLIPPSYPNSLVVEKEPFVDAVRRMRLMVKGRPPESVKMSLSQDGVQLTATNADFGRAVEDVDAKYEGSELTVAFNPSYLLDGLEVVHGEEVMVETVDETKPALVRGVDSGDYRYLLMPVRTP